MDLQPQVTLGGAARNSEAVRPAGIGVGVVLWLKSECVAKDHMMWQAGVHPSMPALTVDCTACLLLAHNSRKASATHGFQNGLCAKRHRLNEATKHMPARVFQGQANQRAARQRVCVWCPVALCNGMVAGCQPTKQALVL